MTLLRRGPREVYRVYAEDDFLGGAGFKELIEPVASVTGERRLRRLAGAAMLAGAVGAVGGVIAVNGLPSTRGTGRKARDGLRSATTPYLAKRAPVERISVAAPRARTLAVRRRRGGYRNGVRRLHADSAPVHTDLERGIPAVAARSIASAPAARSRPEHVEFGFER